MPKIHYPNSQKALENILNLNKNKKFLCYGSGTSTVIPFAVETFLRELRDSNVELISLVKMPKKMLIKDGHLYIEGAVTWEEARSFLHHLDFELMSWPTEQTAQILAGIATSATGERSFSGGTLREQIVSCEMIMGSGEKILLKRDKKLYDIPNSEMYQNEYKYYENLKNGPYPRLQYQTDLAVGSEGQLGIIINAQIKIISRPSPVIFLISLEHSWRKNIDAHLEIFNWVQEMRREILSVEFIDRECLELLPHDKRPKNLSDIIVLEVLSNYVDEVIENFSHFQKISLYSVFEISQDKYHELRIGVPRAVAEYNSHNGLTKKGTDIQVTKECFKDLFLSYQKMAHQNITPSILFGHFGDAHLHFNFLSNKNNEATCLNAFNELYENVLSLKGTPFAEHGIGILKQKFIGPFVPEVVRGVLKFIKTKYDPDCKLFPRGFWSMLKRD